MKKGLSCNVETRILDDVVHDLGDVSSLLAVFKDYSAYPQPYLEVHALRHWVACRKLEL